MNDYLRKHAPRLFLILLTAPYIIAFAPPDTSGTFVYVSGDFSKSSRTFSSCGAIHYVHDRFYDAGVAVDRKIELKKENDPAQPWIKPRYFSVGLFGTLASYQENELIVDTSNGSTDTRHENYLLGAAGAHFALDWKYLGLDLGGLVPFKPDYDYAVPILPCLGIRIGNKIYFSSTILDHPQSLNNIADMGLGYNGKNNRLWLGVSADHAIPYMDARFRHRYGFVSLGFSVKVATGSKDGSGAGLSINAETPFRF